MLGITISQTQLPGNNIPLTNSAGGTLLGKHLPGTQWGFQLGKPANIGLLGVSNPQIYRGKKVLSTDFSVGEHSSDSSQTCFGENICWGTSSTLRNIVPLTSPLGTWQPSLPTEETLISNLSGRYGWFDMGCRSTHRTLVFIIHPFENSQTRLDFSAPSSGIPHLSVLHGDRTLGIHTYFPIIRL
jgi:hypothetical protein